ncbi:hypothetical protein ABZW30_42150 [Kitasatospora sp. NPDC004669]
MGTHASVFGVALALGTQEAAPTARIERRQAVGGLIDEYRRTS